jgi:protein TonB
LEELKEEEKNIEQVKLPSPELLPAPDSAPKLQGAATTAEPIPGPVNPSPQYPDIARRRGWEGTVTIKVFVSKEGIVKNLQVQQSSGYQILDLAAQNTVKSWKFIPAREGDMNLDSWVIIPIQFRLIDQ